MKIPVTDKFLWEIYHFMETLNDYKHYIEAPFGRTRSFRGPLNPVIEKYIREKGRKEFSRFIYHLKRKNYIKISNLKGIKAIIITNEGLSKALKASFVMEGRVKRKDGKWIMVIFDIPKTHHGARNMLKSIICNLGYKLLQQSVWVTPYNVMEKTEKLFQLHSLDRYVKIFLIEEV